MRSRILSCACALVAACATLAAPGCGVQENGTEEVELAAASLPAVATSLQLASTPIAHATVSPSIDGQIDAVWATSTPQPIDRRLVGGAGSLGDSSGYFRALWDARALYLWVDVNDDVRVREGGDPWQDDAVEIYLDGTGARGATYDAQVFQYVFRWDDPVAHVGARSAAADPALRFAMQRTSSGYRLEVAIPWDRLGGGAVAGRALGLEVQNNDDDDGGARDAKLAWTATVDDAWERPRAFRPARLGGDPVVQRATEIPSAPPLPLQDGLRDESYLRSPPHPIARRLRGAATSPSALSATFRALQDGAFLYLFVEVTDDRVVEDSDPATPWDDDAVEVFMDVDQSRGDGFDGVDDLQIVFRPSEWSGHLGLRSVQLMDDAGAATTRTPTGYQMEIVISWDSFPTRLGADQTFGLDVQVDDDDDGGARDHKLAWWASTDESWQRPNLFGVAKRSSGLKSFPTLEGLGDLPGGETESYVSDVSASGEVVVGRSKSAAGDEAVRWTQAMRLVGLGAAPSDALAVSPNGALVVGKAAGGAPAAGGSGIWRGDGPVEYLLGGPVPFEGAPPQLMITGPYVVRDDGDVYGSCIQYAAYGQPLGCRWNGPGNVTLLHPPSAIFAVDAQGNIAGTRYASRLEPIGSVAMLNGKELGYPEGSTCIIPHPCSSEVRAFSTGAVVSVGTSRVPPEGNDPAMGEEPLFDTAFVYTREEGMLRLVDLAGGIEGSAARAISADGSVIGGFGTDDEGQHAVVWVGRRPIRLDTLVQTAGGQIPEGWSLLDVVAMSADGRTLAGNGIDPAGHPQGFRVVLPAAP